MDINNFDNNDSKSKPKFSKCISFLLLIDENVLSDLE